MKRLSFTFSVLQYRHDVWTGEGLNVGVALSCNDCGYLAFKGRSGRGRLARAFPGLDYQALRSAVVSLERFFDRHSSGFGLLPRPDSVRDLALRALPADESSSLVWLPSGSGLTADPAAEHARIFERMVMRYESESGRDVRTDEMVFETVRRKLQRAELYQKFEAHTVVSEFSRVTFDHSFRNGVWHCVQPVSLDSADADRMQAKAARWAGLMQSLQGVQGIKPYFVTGRPQDKSLMRKYETMKRFLASSPLSPRVVDEERSDLVVEEISAAARH